MQLIKLLLVCSCGTKVEDVFFSGDHDFIGLFMSQERHMVKTAAEF